MKSTGRADEKTMRAATTPGGQRRGLRAFWASLTPGQKRTLVMMVSSSAACTCSGS